MADVPGFASDNPKHAKKGPADWQSPKAKTGKGTMIGCTLLALCAVGGAIVAFLTYASKGQVEPYLVTVSMTQYTDPAWPENAWAEGDSERLADCFQDRDGRRLASLSFAFQQKDKFESLLESIAAGTVETDADGKPGTASARPLVVHVSALAVVRDNSVYLLPASARPGDPTTWVPVEKLLDALGKCPAANKLLLLDISKPLAGPFAGVLRNDVGKRLHEILSSRKATLGYPVLTACGPGQTATAAEPAKCTAFALAVAEGLHGAADIYNADRKGNEEVTVAELARFVAARVHRYAKDARNVEQTPQFYPPDGPGADFVLVRGKARKVEFPAARGAYPADLRTAWEKRDDAIAGRASKGYPAALARSTGTIIRAEEKWYGSDRTGPVNFELPAAIHLGQPLSTSSGSGDPASDRIVRARQTVGRVRLVVARTKLDPPPAELGTALDAYLAARFAPPPAPDKPSEIPKLREAWTAKAKGDLPEAAWLVWDRARQHARPKRSDFAVYADAMKELKVLGLKGDYSEIVLVRMLAGRDFYAVQNLLPDPGYALASLLEAEHELGLTLGAGPDGWDLVAAELADAESARTAGQTALFAARNAANLKEADGLLKRAVEKYRSARETLVAWAVANRSLQEATEVVVATHSSAAAWDRPDFAAWERAAEAVAALADLLASARKSGRFPTAAADAAKVAEMRAAVLTTAVGKAAVERMIAENRPRTGPADLAPWQAAASATLAPAAARKTVWDSIVGDLAKFHETARKADEEDFDRSTPTKDPPPLPPGDPEAKPAANRAKVSTALLRIGGLSKADELRARLDRAIVGGSLKDFEGLSDDLRKAWSDDWPKRLEDDFQAGRWADAHRLLRATPPGAARLAAAVGDPNDEPPAAKALLPQVKSYLGSAMGQFAADQPHRARDEAGKSFYAEAMYLAPR